MADFWRRRHKHQGHGVTLATRCSVSTPSQNTDCLHTDVFKLISSAWCGIQSAALIKICSDQALMFAAVSPGRARAAQTSSDRETLPCCASALVPATTNWFWKKSKSGNTSIFHCKRDEWCHAWRICQTASRVELDWRGSALISGGGKKTTTCFTGFEPCFPAKNGKQMLAQICKC